MSKLFKNNFLLILIIFSAFLLRFYSLGQMPVGFHRDEAHLGYNAYSLLKTGRDMTGNFLPLHFSDFLYSPGGYAYISIPFVALFGLNEFSVRFVAAFFGSLTIIITYFLAEELFKKRQVGYLAAFLLAISPWHINLSRVATENVLVVFFLALGVLLYLKWVKSEKKWVLFLSFFSFGLTLLLYQAPRAFLPMFLPLLFLFFHPKNWKKHILIPAGLFLIIIIIPLLLILSSHDLTLRMRMLSIFQNPETQLVLDEQIREDGGNSVLQTRFFHNKVTNYSTTFLENYFSHFSYEFLFTDKGLPDRYRVPQMGLLYLFELPFLLFGLWKLFHYEKKIAFFVLSWIMLAPFGPALTYDDIPNLQRTLIIFPCLSFVSALGFLFVWDGLTKIRFSKIFKAGILLIILYSLLFYLHQYYIHQKNHKPWFRQEGFKELIRQTKTLQLGYDHVLITNFQTDPVIFFLFYNSYNPVAYQKQVAKYPAIHYDNLPFGSYEFSSLACPLHQDEHLNPLTGKVEQTLIGKRHILYVNGGTCKVNDKRVKTISEIKRGDGTVVFKLQKIL